MECNDTLRQKNIKAKSEGLTTCAWTPCEAVAEKITQ